ncbi:MAG: hypothetical protein JJU33_09445 [Phycisphaerales bacterium]|nr:hypothetical protein [Phycisphaerales bacterium]
MADRHDVVSGPFTATLIRIKAAQLCRRTDFSRSDRDDLTQGMLLYLLEKAHLFDPARGNIEAFVTSALDSWVAMELRFRGRQKRRGDYEAISLEGTLVECDGDAVPLRSVLGQADRQRRNQSAPVSQFDAAGVAEAVKAVMETLTPEDRDLLRLVAEHGKSAAAREWSRRSGGPVSRRQIQNALERLRARFEAAGFGTA